MEPLRQFFKDEASAKVENKPELIPLNISTRSAIEVLREPPTLSSSKKDEPEIQNLELISSFHPIPNSLIEWWVKRKNINKVK